MRTKWTLRNTVKLVVTIFCAVFICVIFKGIVDNEIVIEIHRKRSQSKPETSTPSYNASTPVKNNTQVLVVPSITEAPTTTEDPLCTSFNEYSAIGEMEEDILCLEPIKFLEDYKNPCWASEVSGNLRCIPYFQVIGMDKCGTTDLFDRIGNHPEILYNDGILNKETWWWSWRRYGHSLIYNTEKQYFEDYTRYFMSATKTIEKSRNTTTGYHSLITGDGTPMDIWDFTGWPQIPQNRGLQEPKYLTPHLIHHINPQTKFIIILRNPIDRLYSDYYFLNLHGNTRLTFHRAVEDSIFKLRICQRSFGSLRKCLYSRDLTSDFNKKARIHLGFYSVFLKEWFSVFPREQFLILKTGEYSRYLYHELNKVFGFLNVRKLSWKEMTNLGILTPKHKHENSLKRQKYPMLEETRTILRQLYKPYIKELYGLLQDKKFLWDFEFLN